MKISDSISKQILERGISLDEIKNQILLFKKGTPPVKLVSSATIGNGISEFSEERNTLFVSDYERESKNLEILKFVPASGSATRMFKFLYHFLDNFDPEKDTLNAYTNRYKTKDISLFLVGLEKLPFYDKVLRILIKKNQEFAYLEGRKKLYLFVSELLSVRGLNYGNQPKGLIPFHKYQNNILSSAFEEHLFEAVLYGSSKGSTKVHFTISEDFKGAFTEEFNRIKTKVETITNSKLEIFFSYQKKVTDTIALNMDNTLFLDNARLLFRPSGHGALIENLNDIEADIVFIKNIDNVVAYKYKHQVARYKKMLGGVLLELRAKVYGYQKAMTADKISKVMIAEIMVFMSERLNIYFPDNFSNYKTKFILGYISDRLNRPIRVCGMVENEGEPGGGPFWLKTANSEMSLQIVESGQIDMLNDKQQAIFNKSTHFNPVDIVCSLKNYKGESYNLLDFVDSSTSFVSPKTHTGIPLKSLERPGLWNGAMAYWNSVFVEVPLSTFNPVKSVNDLLKPAHQASNEN